MTQTTTTTTTQPAQPAQPAHRYQLMGLGTHAAVIDMETLHGPEAQDRGIVFCGPYSEAEAECRLRNLHEENASQEASQRLERALSGAARAMREAFDRLRSEGGPR